MLASCARFLANIELDQDVSLVNGLAGFEMNLIDCPGKVGANRNALDGFRGSDHGQSRRPGFLLRDHGSYGRGRHLEAGAGRDCRFDLPVFHETEPTDKGSHQQQHDEHSLRHTFSAQK